VSEAQRVFIQKLLVKNPPDRPTGKKALTLLPKSIDAKPPQQARANSKTKVTEEAQEGKKTRTGLLFKLRRGTKKRVKATVIEKLHAAEPSGASITIWKKSPANTPTALSTELDNKGESKPAKSWRRPQSLKVKTGELLTDSRFRKRNLALSIVSASVLCIGMIVGGLYVATGFQFETDQATSTYEWDGYTNPAMPDFKGKSPDEVKEYLRSIGINNWIDRAVDSSVPKGTVLSTKPSAGETIDRIFWNTAGNWILIFVSTGKSEDTASEYFTAVSPIMNVSDVIPDNWGYYAPTISSGILKVNVDARFEENTNIILGQDCSYLVNRTLELDCDTLPDKLFLTGKDWISPIPFEMDLTGSDIKKPSNFRIDFKVEDSKGIRDVQLNFTVNTWK
jgi:hypothetical protein